MVNRTLVSEHAQMIRASITRLRELACLSREEFSQNPDNFAIAEHHLRRALQGLLDLGRHLVVKGKLGSPSTYREVMDLLEEGKVLSPTLAQKVRGIAGYRNRMVHDYARMGEEEMWNILQTELEDLPELLSKLLSYAAEIK